MKSHRVDNLKVRGLIMTPKNVKRIVIYLRGKGQVGKVRAARMMQFADTSTLVFGPYYEGIMAVRVKMNFMGRI